MEGSVLRSLAREYRRGELSRDAYRARRRQLIHDLASRRIPLTYRAMKPPVRRYPKLRRGARVAAASLVLVAAGLTAWLALVQPAGEIPANADRARALPASPGASRLERFVRANDWSPARLEALASDWGELTAFQREQAKRTFWYRRFGDGLKTRIRENAALVRLESDEADENHLQKLRETAEVLDVEISDPPGSERPRANPRERTGPDR